MLFNQSVTQLLKTVATTGCLVSVALLQSCAQREVVPVFTADPAAFEYAVSETASMQLYVQQCAQLSSDMQKASAEAQAAWYQRNWPQAAIADAKYSEQLASKTLTYNNESIALPAFKLYATLEKETRLRLDQTRHSHNNVVDYCTRKMAAYKDGTQDWSQNKNAGLYLKSLANASAGAPHKVPTLAGSLSTNSEPGRSQFALEKKLAEHECADAEILTLRNDWPHEVYGAFCTTGKSIFVSCEWGECQTQ